MAEQHDGIFTEDVKSEYCFKWKIGNFSKDFDLLESKTFTIYPMCNSSWKILVKFCSQTQTLQIGMRRIDDYSHLVVIESEFFVRNSKGTLFVTRDLSKMFSCDQESLYCDEDLNKPTNFSGVKNDLGVQFRLCSDDVLVIEGTVKIVPCCHRHNFARDQNTDKLCNALKTSLAENIYTDIQIVVGGEVINAHKFMLASRSPVFKCMLETKMKEKTDNKIEISDVDKSVFDMFLTFLYTGSVPYCKFPMLMQLYAVADKYDVQSLFETCSCALFSDISEENVCDILSLAESHNDKSLSDKAFQYLCDDFELVEPTGEWERFVKENPRFAAKVVLRVASNISAMRET